MTDELSDQEKVERDLLLTGQAFTVGGKHVPVESVVIHSRECDHSQWSWEKHGRVCPCGVFMVDFGD